MRYDDGQALEDNDGPEPIRALFVGCGAGLLIWLIVAAIAWVAFRW